MNNPVLAVSGQLAGTVRRHAPSVVAVHASRRFPSGGILWRPGIVVTAEHTIRDENDITVSLDGRTTVPAELVGRDAGTDVAVLRVEAPAPAAPIERGSPPALEPGTLVLTIGRSPNAGPVASMGIISAVSGSWRTWRGGRLDHYIRLDVAMYPGSSGAAVVDAEGAVLGMATSALSRMAGVAVPAATMDRVVDALLATGHIPRSYLGIAMQPVRLPEHQIQEGASQGIIVMMVEPVGPAANAGILIGDILVAVNGMPSREIGDVQNALESQAPGTVLRLTLLRGGRKQETAVTLAERPPKEN